MGDALHGSAENEWAAVCWFYCAYHLIKAVMLEDPVFDDAARLAACDPPLQRVDRDVTKHQARGGKHAQDVGMREVIRALYPEIRGAHGALHQASINVRYEQGYPVPLDKVKERLVEVKEWASAAQARTT